jgi:hypothetical protein
MDKWGESFGYDVSTELSKILSGELTKEIDKEILRNLGIEPKNKLRKQKIEKIYVR